VPGGAGRADGGVDSTGLLHQLDRVPVRRSRVLVAPPVTIEPGEDGARFDVAMELPSKDGEVWRAHGYAVGMSSPALTRSSMRARASAAACSAVMSNT